MRFSRSARWTSCIALACLASATRGAAQHNEEMGIARAGVSPAAAQRVRPVRLLPGIQFGGSLPTSELGDLYGTGFRAGLTLTAVFPALPYGVRAALTYDRFGGGTVTPPGNSPVTVDAASMTSLTVTGLISERAARSALLYLTAGIGLHRLDAEALDTLGTGDDEPVDDPDLQPTSGGAATKFGASVGGGLTFRVAGLPSYIEIQAVKLFGADALVIPVVIGVQLGR